MVLTSTDSSCHAHTLSVCLSLSSIAIRYWPSLCAVKQLLLVKPAIHICTGKKTHTHMIHKSTNEYYMSKNSDVVYHPTYSVYRHVNHHWVILYLLPFTIHFECMYYLFTVYILYIHKLFSVCLIFIYYIFITYLLHAHAMSTKSYISGMLTVQSLSNPPTKSETDNNIFLWCNWCWFPATFIKAAVQAFPMTNICMRLTVFVKWWAPTSTSTTSSIVYYLYYL